MTSSRDSEEVIYYRRLIYTSFSGLVNEQQALKAVSIWANYFTDTKVFSPVRFVRVCKEALNIPNELAKVLVGRLTENLNRPVDMLKPDPFAGGEVPDASVRQSQVGSTSAQVIQNAIDRRARRTDPGLASTPQAQSHKSKPPEQTLFEFMLSNLLNGVWPQRRELIEYLSESNLTPPCKVMLKRWSQASAPQLMIPDLEVSEMSQAIDIIYVWYCDLFGPGATDQSFARLIAQAERLPEASFFSPRRFL